MVYLDAKSTDGDAEGQPFWALLGGSPAEVAGEEAGGSDEDPAPVEASIHRVSVADGVQVVSTGKSISCQDLISTQVHLVDSGSEVYVWIGKTSPLEDRKVAMATASTYLKDAARPAWTPISRLIETGETPVFKNIFSKWDRVGAEPARPTKTVPQVGASVAKVVAEEKVDVTSLYTRKREAQHMVDDGTGALQVWRVENFKKVEVPKEQYGQFYSGDSYVMLYTYASFVAASCFRWCVVSLSWTTCLNVPRLQSPCSVMGGWRYFVAPFTFVERRQSFQRVYSLSFVGQCSLALPP